MRPWRPRESGLDEELRVTERKFANDCLSNTARTSKPASVHSGVRKSLTLMTANHRAYRFYEICMRSHSNVKQTFNGAEWKSVECSGDVVKQQTRRHESDFNFDVSLLCSLWSRFQSDVLFIIDLNASRGTCEMASLDPKGAAETGEIGQTMTKPLVSTIHIRHRAPHSLIPHFPLNLFLLSVISPRLVSMMSVSRKTSFPG